MLIGADGRPEPVHYTPPPPPPPPRASDVSAAKQALQKQLGSHAPDDGAALAAAIKKIQQENAALTEAALARAAVLLQQQYDASHHQPQDASVDPFRQAASQVGLTHQFDAKTLDAAANALSGSALDTAPAGTPSSTPTVSLADARSAIQTGLDNGLTWQEAVNAARVQFGGAAQNETVLDEAALTVKGDQLASGSDAKSGNVLADASQQLAGLHLFDGANDKAAVAALSVTLKPSSALAADAKQADSAWATLQRDQAAHASAATIEEDLQVYHDALGTELNDAANQPADGANGSLAWLGDPSKSDLRWQAQQAVIAANTANGNHDAPSASELLTSLRASQIADTAAAARGTGESNAPGNLRAAQVLTQQLKGVPTDSALYKETMGDMRIAALHDAALADITGAHGDNAQDTLVAEGRALSGYRDTVLFPSLSHDTLASGTTQHNLDAVGTPGKLADIANLLDPIAKASPELAQALAAKLQGKIGNLIGNGPPYTGGVAQTPEEMDAYYGPISRIVQDAGGPKSATAKPVVDALRAQLLKQQTELDRVKNLPDASPYNAFVALAYMSIPANNDPTAVYQSLIDEAPNGELAKTLMQYTGLKAQPAPLTPATNGAGSLASAQIALDAQLRTGPVNADTLQKALAAARKDKPSISDQTWAEAVIARQAQSDAAANAASKTKAPADLVAQASGEVASDQLFDADTMNAATGALQSGQIGDGGLEPTQPMSLAPGQPDAAQYMQSLVAGGMTMPEAIALTKAWLSGAPNADLVLTQAALTVAGQQSLPAYYGDPGGADPIDQAAQELKKMKLLDAATIDLAVNGRPAANGQPAVTGMKQDVKPDLAALNGARGKPGLIDQVDTAYSAWQTAQTKANQAGSSAQDKTAAQNALRAYHTALSAALNAAAGRAPTDGGWQSNPLYADTMWKAQNELELAALAPQIVAAQYAGQHSPQASALDNAFQQWQTGLNALQIIGQVQYAQQTAAQPGDPSSGDVAAAEALTNETYGLQQAAPQLYQQVMGDAVVANLESAALASITSAAAPPTACTVDGNDSPDPKARLHAAGTRLQAYEGTTLYAQLVDGVAKDPVTQQLFSTIASSVNGQKSDADKLKTLADTIEGTSPDLAAMLVDQMFRTGGNNGGFSPSQLVAWTKSASDMTQISRIYVAAGGAQNADMTALRKSLETMVTGDQNFGKVSYDSRLNTQIFASEGGAVVWGEDLGFGDLKKNGVQMQLAQDMLDDAPGSDLGVEIARETGFKSLGAPAAPVSTSGPGATPLASDVGFDPSGGLALTQGGHLAGLSWQDGMQTVTSYDQLLNTIGASNGLKVDHAPSSLADERALAYGQFALYDPNDTVFDAKGRKTTLGQVAQSLMRGEGVATPGGLSPVTIASLSGEWWNTRTPSQGQQGTTFTLLEGVGADGRMIDVGPADTTARYGYTDWQSHTGFDNGYMMAQPHWVTSASGVVQMGSAYFVDYKPYDHWYDWDHLKTDLEMAAMVVGGVLAMITLPESAPLWLVLLSEAADAGFALSAAVGTASSLQKIFGTPGGAGNWVNWVQLAANAFGGAASGFGALARTGTMMDRLAAAAPAFQDAARVSAVARDATPLEFARAEVEATLEGSRAVRAFDDTWLSRVMTRPLTASDAALLRTMSRTAALRALQATKTFRVVGVSAMATNAASMGVQGYTLMKAGGQASAQDWLNLFLSAGLLASGVGVQRMRTGDPKVAAARVTAINETLPDGVRLLESGDVEIAPAAFARLDDANARTIALLTGRSAIASVAPAAALLRDAGLLDSGGGNANATAGALSADEVQVINDALPAGLRVTQAGTLIVGETTARDSVAQAAALVAALRVLNDRAQRSGDAGQPVDRVVLAADVPANETVSGAAAEPVSQPGSSGDGSLPVTLPAARGAPADATVSVPLHELTSSGFAASPLGERLFGTAAGGRGDVASAQQQWLANEVVPRVAATLVAMKPGLPGGAQPNGLDWRVIVGADGHVVSVLATEAAGHAIEGVEGGLVQTLPQTLPQTGGASAAPARVFALPADGASAGAIQGGSVPAETGGRGNALFGAVANHLVAAINAGVPADWLAAPFRTATHAVALDESGQQTPWSRITAATALLREYAAYTGAQTAHAAGEGESVPPDGATLARIATFAQPAPASAATAGRAQSADGIDASTPALIGAVARDAGSNGQRARQQQGDAGDEAGNPRAQQDARVARVVPDQQQSRGTRDGHAQQQADDEPQRTSAQAKAAAGAKPAAPAGRGTNVDDAQPAPAIGNPREPAPAAAKPPVQAAGEPGLIAGQKITRYHVKSAIRVIKARFGKLILPDQQPDATQVALLEPGRFSQARRQAASEGRGSFDDSVFGFTVVDGTMKIDGRDVRVVLPASIAPENVTASSLLMHDMLHFAQSPEFVSWSRELNARLNADAQVQASGWFGIDSHEGLTELFNVRIKGGAGAPGADNTSFAAHVYESFRQGYQAILYALDGAVNEVVVERIGEDVAARAYFQADPEALQAYETAMFDVYRNTPRSLVDLREFVLQHTNAARSGDGVDRAAADDAHSVAPAPDSPVGQGAPDAAARTAGDVGTSSAAATAKAEASRLIASLRAKTAAKMAEVAYARITRMNGGDDANRAGGGSRGDSGAQDSTARRAARRIAARLASLRANRPAGDAAPAASDAQAGETLPAANESEAGTDADNLFAAMNARNVLDFYLLDGAGRAARSLRDKSEIVLVTGFSVDVDAAGQPMPETDGPPGTAYLARVIEKLGEARSESGGKPMRVTVVTDTANRRVMRASLDALGANHVKIELFDTPYGPAPTNGEPYDSGAGASAAQLLDRLAPDAVVAIELPAHTSVDGPINMRGKSVKGFNSARDALVEVANERGIATFGVGDGGNEAGVVQKTLRPWVRQNIPTVKLADGTELEFRSAVPVDSAVTAWNSSLGAQGIGVAMLKLEGRLDLAPDGAAYAASIDACARAGAVDGVSRVRAAAVDGFSASLHDAFTNALIETAKDDHGVFLPERPPIVVVFDSSNGALVAHQELEAEISHKTGRAVQFVYVVDHGNAPYGQYAQRLDTLADLVRHALQTGDEIPSAELIVMACNTAHGPHYEQLMDLGAGIRPVINLIETTANMMLDEGGAHPALFATATTVSTHMYRDQVHTLSDGQVAVQEVAAPQWADFVNRMEHASTDRAVRARVQANVNEIVGGLDENTTSVWLCCTHYPALEAQIRTALDARGMNDVQIFNPMTEQGDVARAAIGWDALPDGVAPLVRNPAPLVLTTGDAAQVQADARELTGYAGVHAIHLDSFGAGADMSAVHDALARPKLRPISRALATQWSSGGALHHGAQTHIFVPDGAETAAAALAPEGGVTMIVVGAEQGAADGVTGASLLGSGLAQRNADNVYVVPDEKTRQSVLVAHAAAGAGRPKIEVFEPGDDARQAAAGLLARVGPASVVAVKVYGRNAAGHYYTTEGRRVDAVPLDEILIEANERRLATVGIGDAPVYAGLHTTGEGPWYEVRPFVSGFDGPMVNPGSVVTSMYPVTGPTATAASDGLLGALQAAGQLDVLLTPEQFGAVISVGRDRYGNGNRTTVPGDQHLNGLRGSMTEALHEIVLALRNLNVPPDPVPLDPVPEADAAPGESGGPGEVAYARVLRWGRGNGDDAAGGSGGDGGKATGTGRANAAGAAGDPGAAGNPGAAANTGSTIASGTAGNAEAGRASTVASAAIAEPDHLVSGDQWGALLARLDQGDLRTSADAYVYLVQSSRDPQAPGASGGISGRLVGWGVFRQGTAKGRWLGQGPLDGPPGQRIANSPLAPERIPADHYVVISRRPPGEAGTSGRFPDAQWIADPAAIAWPDVRAVSPAGETGAVAPVAEQSKASSATPASSATSTATASSAPAKPAANGKPMRWTRIGATFGGAAGTAAATIDLAGHLALPAATASLCFIYRGSVVALRTRLGTLISRHVAGAGGADPASHLDWIDRWLVQRGAAWGINRSVRRQYATAVTTLRATPGDADALAVLARAPAQLYMPRTVLGNVNDLMQSATLAANVSINGAYLLENGVSHGVAPFLTNLGFGLSNAVLTTKNLSARLAAPLRSAALGATLRVQDAAQAFVMTGYSLATIPWGWSDFEIGSPLGIVKGGLDVVFGMGAAGQALNDTRKVLSGSPGTFRIGRVHPLMFLGAGAIARFALQIATLPPAPVAQVPGNGPGNGQQRNGQHGPQPGSGQHTPAPGASSRPPGSTGSQHGGKPGTKPGTGSNQGPSNGNGSQSGKPDEVQVKDGQSLWLIAEDHLNEILSASERARLEPQGENAQAAAALHQLLQLNRKFDANPDLIFPGQTVVLNDGSSS